MCLVTKEVNGKTIQTAEQDIVCYKRVTAFKKKWTPVYSPLAREYGYNKVLTAEKHYWSPWRKPDVLHPIPPVGYKEIEHLQSAGYVFTHTEMEGDKKVEGRVINEGFHAHLKYKDAMCPSMYTSCSTKLCIIPKGTEICYGVNDDIVAVNMIVFRNVFQYWMYKLRKSFGK